jgi:hypothetical protein
MPARLVRAPSCMPIGHRPSFPPGLASVEYSTISLSRHQVDLRTNGFHRTKRHLNKLTKYIYNDLRNSEATRSFPSGFCAGKTETGKP